MRKWRYNEAVFWTLSNIYNLLNANPTKWLNTLKQFVGKLPNLVFKGIMEKKSKRTIIDN